MPSIRATGKYHDFWGKTKLDGGYSQVSSKDTARRQSVSKNVLKRDALPEGWRWQFSAPFVGHLYFFPFVLRLIYVKNNLNFPLLPSKWYARLFIFANVKYLYERLKIFIWDGTHCNYYNDQACSSPRDSRLSPLWGPNWGPLKHHSTMI